MIFSSKRLTPKGTMVHIGDSNTNGRPGYKSAYQLEWFAPGGIFEGWTSYNMGRNGSTLDGYINDLSAGDHQSAPADYTPTNQPPVMPYSIMWATVNADPDLIFVSLGTNDLNNPNSRISIGTTENLRANLSQVVNFLLEHTTAGIMLRIPAPMGYDPLDAFGSLTQFTSADDAAEASARLRAVYLEWENRNDRVQIFDTQRLLTGLRCDFPKTDCMDPEGQGRLMYDNLHPTDLGFRRIAEYMARQMGDHAPLTTNTTEVPEAIAYGSFWSTSFNGSFGATYGQDYIVNVEYSPQRMAGNSWLSQSRTSTRPTPKSQLQNADIVGMVCDFSIIERIKNTPQAGTLFCWATKTTHTYSSISLAQVVTRPDGSRFAQVKFADITPPLSSTLPSNYTISGKTKTSIPYYTPRMFQITYPGYALNNILWPWAELHTIAKVIACRNSVSYSAPVLTLYEQNAEDCSFTTGGFPPPGRPIGTITFPAGIHKGVWALNTANYPNGFRFTNANFSRLAVVQTAGTPADIGNNVSIILSE